MKVQTETSRVFKFTFEMDEAELDALTLELDSLLELNNSVDNQGYGGGPRVKAWHVPDLYNTFIAELEES